MNDYPIGIFDSGIGGLTVAHAIRKVLPNEDIIYFGDTEHLPYGEKSKEAIKSYCRKIITFLIEKKCKAIIIACNSASSFADQDVIKLANQTPIFNVIDPVISEICSQIDNSKIGVIGTKATITSKIYERKIKEINSNKVIQSLATPLLAPLIEEGFINESISSVVISKYLSNQTLDDIKHLVLACTHYPLIYKEIKQYYKGKINIIDSSKIVANFVVKELKKHNLISNKRTAKYQFYVSNYTESFEKSANFFFKEKIKLEEVNLFSNQ
tara:strand:+ start:92 stop:898 length:807 start_codon:yes stop_codon:yes gene_type:complete